MTEEHDIDEKLTNVVAVTIASMSMEERTKLAESENLTLAELDDRRVEEGKQAPR